MKETLIFIEEKIRRIVELESYIFEHNKFYYDGKKENDNLKKQIEELTDKLNESNRDLKVLTKQLDEQFSLSEMLKSKLSESCRKVETLKETGTNLYKENESLKSEIKKNKEAMDFQNGQLSHMVIVENDLDATNNLLKKEIESLNTTNQLLKQEIKSLVLEIERKDILLNDTELTIQSFTSNKESYDKLSIENYELKQENGIWINEIKDLQTQNKELKQEIESFRKLNSQDLISKNQIELKESLKEQLEIDFSVIETENIGLVMFFHENEIDSKDKNFYSKSIELLTENIMKIVRIYF